MSSTYSTPLTQVGVEERIVAISDWMELAVEELAKLSDDSAEAEADYKIRYAQAILKAGARTDGTGRGGRLTEGDKEATAIGECEDLLRRRLITESKMEVKQEALRSARARLDALRTISANIRAQT